MCICVRKFPELRSEEWPAKNNILIDITDQNDCFNKSFFTLFVFCIKTGNSKKRYLKNHCHENHFKRLKIFIEKNFLNELLPDINKLKGIDLSLLLKIHINVIK
jgi:hypothetical protein